MLPFFLGDFFLYVEVHLTYLWSFSGFVENVAVAVEGCRISLVHVGHMFLRRASNNKCNGWFGSLYP